MAAAAAPRGAEWLRLARGGSPTKVPAAPAAASSLRPSPPLFLLLPPFLPSLLPSGLLSFSLSPPLLPALSLPLVGLHPHSLFPASCHLCFSLAHHPGATLSRQRQTPSSDSSLLGQGGRRPHTPANRGLPLHPAWVKVATSGAALPTLPPGLRSSLGGGNWLLEHSSSIAGLAPVFPLSSCIRAHRGAGGEPCRPCVLTWSPGVSCQCPPHTHPVESWVQTLSQPSEFSMSENGTIRPSGAPLTLPHTTKQSPITVFQPPLTRNLA